MALRAVLQKMRALNGLVLFQFFKILLKTGDHSAVAQDAEQEYEEFCGYFGFFLSSCALVSFQYGDKEIECMF